MALPWKADLRFRWRNNWAGWVGWGGGGGKSEEQRRGTGLDHPPSVFLEGLTTERFPEQVNSPWLRPGAPLIRRDNGLPQISPFLHNVCQQTLGIRSHSCLLSICAFQSVKADTPLVDPRLIEKFLSFQSGRGVLPEQHKHGWPDTAASLLRTERGTRGDNSCLSPSNRKRGAAVINFAA